MRQSYYSIRSRNKICITNILKLNGIEFFLIDLLAKIVPKFWVSKSPT